MRIDDADTCVPQDRERREQAGWPARSCFVNGTAIVGVRAPNAAHSVVSG